MRRRSEEAEPTGYVAPRDESGRIDRDVHRDRMEELHTLTERLARLPTRIRRSLPLDEETLDHLDQLAAANPRADRRRLVLRARTLLAGNDLEALDRALCGQGDAALQDQVLIRWRSRILAEGDSAIQEFLLAFPGGDRQGVRTAARDAGRTGAAGVRAQARLLELLRDAAAAVEE